MGSFEELNLTVQGVRTRVLKGGAGPDLFYWHGAGGGGRWHLHHELLARHFTVYAPDHPGWGGSDTPEWMDTVHDYVLHYDSLLRTLAVDRPILVGHSLGGWMAAEFAITYPDCINTLVLVNAAGYPYDATQAVPDFFAEAARGGSRFAQLVFHKMDAAAAFFPSELTAEDHLRRFHELTSTARLGWHTWFEAKLPRRLSRLTKPTLVLWGGHERLFPIALAQKYADAIPDAQLKILDDCGHMVPFENPEALSDAVVELHKRAR